MATRQLSKSSPKSAEIPGVGRQAVEGNPLTHDEIKMFEMFEREGWSPERRRAHIIAMCKPKAPANIR